MLCKCSGKYIDIYFILKITFSVTVKPIAMYRFLFIVFMVFPAPVDIN